MTYPFQNQPMARSPRNLLKDTYDILYESFSSIRFVSRIVLLVIGRISPAFRKKINEKIEVDIDMPLQFHESDSVPYGGIILNVHNENHSALSVEALQINLSLSRNDSIFQTFYWDSNTISEPPRNFNLPDIPGKESGKLTLSAMLPYFLYFPNRDMTIFVDGTIKFETDAGAIEHDFEARTRLLRERLWNMSTVQEDLIRNFSPSESAYEKERESE